MSNIINLKEIVLDYKPGNFAPDILKMRHHALEVLNYIEKCENFVVNPEERLYNTINYGDFAVIKNEKN